MLRNYHHRALNIPVRIRNVRDIRRVVNDGGVVDVRNRDVADGRIADVDSGHVRLAHGIRRHIHFPRTQWKPSHIAAEATGPPADEYH